MTPRHVLRWTEPGRAGQPVEHHARWCSANAAAPPDRVVVADDRTTAAAAHRLARAGTALLWRGDYHNARQLLRALGRRVAAAEPPATTWATHRAARARRATLLGRLLVPLDGTGRVALRRAPDTARACAEAWGPPDGGPTVVPLPELLGAIGAHEWRRRGVPIAALDGARIHPHHGVFSPVRGEYVDLVATAPLPAAACGGTGLDLGTGTGVLAAVLAGRGVRRVTATDHDPRAVACARENLARLGLAGRVTVHHADLYPPHGRADLVVCNPPWLPERPNSPLDHAVYDPEGRMLHGFVAGLADHLTPGGEGWLVLSDLAEHLDLRPRDHLLAAFAAARLRVVDRLDARPTHRRAGDAADPLHRARSAEVTSLWRLAAETQG
ncbi:methyltransferase domain-containing protein [Streptomyces sp. 8K308]|uniref:methyltransferase n=1 Tax=Streptomyces sp. 8K308 TaxID=2530388 RepID=UPI00104FA00A|nr:methyltransferase [Streptomyces sp. 8K308]TDC12754.1 methyltransferase domain-containing protein [Streptomyces sp. 8K308]